MDSRRAGFDKYTEITFHFYVYLSYHFQSSVQGIQLCSEEKIMKIKHNCIESAIKITKTKIRQKQAKMIS